MKRWLKRLGLAVFAVICLALWLVVGAVAVLQTEWGGRKILRDRLVAKVDEAIQGDLQAGRVRLRGGTLILEDVKLYDPDGELVAEIERLVATLKLSSLLQRRVDVTEVLVQRPSVHVVQDAEGTNLQRALEPVKEKEDKPEEEGGELPVDIVLREARVEDGHLSFVSRTGEEPFEAELTDFDLLANLSLLDKGETLDAAVKVDAQMQSPAEGPMRVSLGVEGRGDVMNVDIDGDVAGAKLAAKATVETEAERLKATVERLEVPPRFAKSFVDTYPLLVPVTGEGEVVRDGPEVVADLTFRAGTATMKAEANANTERPWAERVEVRGAGIDFSQLIEDGPKSDVSFTLRGHGGGDSLETLKGEVRLTAPASPMAGETFGPVEVVARADEGAWVLEQLEAVVPGAALTARGQGDQERVKLFARLAAKDLAAFSRTLGKLAGPEGIPLSGNGALALRVEGPIEGPSLQLTGRLPYIRYDQHRANDVRIGAQVENVREPLAGDVKMKLSARAAQVGEQHLRRPSATVSLDERKLALAARTRGAIRIDLSGRGLVDEDAQGLRLSALTLRYPEARWTLEQPARVRFEEDLLLVEDLALSSGQQRLAVDARRTGERLNAHVVIDDLALNRLPKDLVTLDQPLAGTLNLDLRAEGQADDPAVTVKGSLAEGRYGEVRDVDVSVEAQYANDRAEGQLRSAALGAKLSLDFDVPVKALQTGAPAPLRADLVLEEVSFGEVARALDEPAPAEGLLSARAKLRGTARAPKLDATAEVKGLKTGEQPPMDVVLTLESAERDRLRMTVNAKGDDARPSELFLQTPWTLARLIRRPPTAEQAMRAPIVLTGELHRLPVPFADPTGHPSPDRQFARLSGTVDLRGTALAPRGDVDLRLEEFGAGELFPLTAQLTLDLAKATQLLKARVVQGERQLLVAEAKLDAPVADLRRVRMLRKAPLTVTMEAGPVNLPELQAFMATPAQRPGEEPMPQLRGLLHAQLEATGNLNAPVVDAGLSIHGLGAAAAQGMGDLSVRFNHEDGRSRVAADLLSRGGELAMRLSAPISLAWSSLEKDLALSSLPVHGSLNARNFDPSFLAGLTPQILALGGKIDAAAELTGNVALPQVKGQLTWENGLVSLAGQGRYEDIRLRVRGTEQEIILEEAFARSGEGTAALSGSLVRRGEGADLNAEARLDDFPIVSDFQRVATVSMRATATGDATVERLTLSRLHIPEARVVLPAEARRELHELEPPDGIVFYYDGEPLDPEKAGKPLEEGVAAAEVGGADSVVTSERQAQLAAEDERTTKGAEPATDGEGEEEENAQTAAVGGSGSSGLTPEIEIHLDAPRNIWVTGQDMNVEVGFGPEFRILVPEEEPLLFGELKILRGRVDVLGRRFDLSDDSTVVFTGPMMQPRLNVIATHENRREEVLVTLRVTGQGEDLQIEPSSDPPLTDTEIYTLIATGRRSLQPGGRSSNGGGSAATSALGSLATAQLQKGLRQVLPLDILSIEQGESGVGTARVEAGTYLSDRLYLGIASEIGAELEQDENRNELLIEYQLWRRWVLELEYGDARKGGADLLWRKQY